MAGCARPGYGLESRMDIDLDFMRTRGRTARPIVATVKRELQPSDIATLQDERESVAPAIKRISERHHALARNLAGGMSPSEAAIVCGYVGSRVSILLDDPAFKELLNFYRADVNAQYRDLHVRLSGLALDAAEELSARLEEKPEEISITALMELTKMGAVRTGFGPQSSTTNLNVNVDLAGRLQRARERVAERQALSD